ncbi:glutaredoxin family protein [Paraglaciecola sp. 2405UD69-4]|uniref:glutaredoxin family protein n=1 Tax=Paraglaciecola sp. 2405UD69-4 TaxID=3391836 RepID=UPI0039C9B13D
MSLIFYSGKECCLCDQAESLLREVSPKALAMATKVDVRSSTDLYHNYGARIPVLLDEQSQTELAWPFNKEQLEEFLS